MQWGSWKSSCGVAFELRSVPKKLCRNGFSFYRALLVASDGTRILILPRARKTPQLYVTLGAQLCFASGEGGHLAIRERVETLYRELGFTCYRSVLSSIDLRRDAIGAIAKGDLSALAGSHRTKPTHYSDGKAYTGMSLYGTHAKVCVYDKRREMEVHEHAQWYDDHLRRAGVTPSTPVTRFEVRLGKGRLKAMNSGKGFDLDLLTPEKIDEMWAYVTCDYVQAVTPETAGKSKRDRKVTALWLNVQKSRYVPRGTSGRASTGPAPNVSVAEPAQLSESAGVASSVVESGAAETGAGVLSKGAVPAFVQRSVFSSCSIDAKVDTSSPAIGAALSALVRRYRGPHGFLPAAEGVLPAFRSKFVTGVEVAEVAPMRGSDGVRVTLRVQGELPAWKSGPNHRPHVVSARITVVLRGDVPERVKIQVDERSCRSARCDGACENVSPVLLDEYMRGALATLQLCLSRKRRPRAKFADQQFAPALPPCCSSQTCAGVCALGSADASRAPVLPPRARGDRPARVAASRARGPLEESS